MTVLISDPAVLRTEVRECDEPLLSVKGHPTLRHSEKRLPDNPLFHLARQGVVERLAHAASLLPAGVFLQVDEGLRPQWLQRHWYDGHKARLRARSPDLTDEALHAETIRFIADPDSLAPHTTGGAVDVCLVDAAGQELDLGSPPDVPAHLCEGRCNTLATNLEPEAAQRRRWLITAMSAAGFVNYFTEWWHWSWGDQYWAFMSGDVARYSVAQVASADA